MTLDEQVQQPATRADLTAAVESLAQVIADMGASLQREMTSGFDRIDAATLRNTKC